MTERGWLPWRTRPVPTGGGEFPWERQTAAGLRAMRRREAKRAQGPRSGKGPGGPRLLGEMAHREAETCQVLREEKAPDHPLLCTSHFGTEAERRVKVYNRVVPCKGRLWRAALYSRGPRNWAAEPRPVGRMAD